MARMYSRKKGISGSTKLVKRKKHSWVNLDIKVIEQLISKFSKAGKSDGEIGVILRDSYGLPDVKTVTNRTISKIVKDQGIKKEIPDDLKALIKKDIALTKHREINKKDMSAKRGQQLTQSKIDRLVKYYKKKGVLVSDWKYSKEEASRWVS